LAQIELICGFSSFASIITNPLHPMRLNLPLHSLEEVVVVHMVFFANGNEQDQPQIRAVFPSPP